MIYSKLIMFSFLFFVKFSTCSQNIFLGGNGTGFGISNPYAQSFTSVFAGGENDGFATIFYNQIGAPLPIKIIYFNVKNINNLAELEWKTSSEINASHFEIERSIDAVKFDKIGEIKAGNSEIYQFTDLKLSAIEQNRLVYYRLKMIDLDGKYSVTPIRMIAINISENNVVNAYPNPTTGLVNFDIEKNNGNEKLIFTIFDLSGKVLKFFELRNQINEIPKIDLSSYQNGSYFILIQTSKIKIIKKIQKY